jgi:hypothetical protein
MVVPDMWSGEMYKHRTSVARGDFKTQVIFKRPENGFIIRRNLES